MLGTPTCGTYSRARARIRRHSTACGVIRRIMMLRPDATIEISKLQNDKLIICPTHIAGKLAQAPPCDRRDMTTVLKIRNHAIQSEQMFKTYYIVFGAIHLLFHYRP